MANGSPVVNIDMPSEWPLGSGEVTQINGVLTEAGNNWVAAKLLESNYSQAGSSNLVDPMIAPTITNVGGVLTASFTKAAQAAEESKGGEGIWFSGKDALRDTFQNALDA